MKKLLLAVLLVFALSTTAVAEDFGIWERLQLLNIIPRQATRDRAIVINDITDKVQLTQEEMKEYEAKVVGTQWNWNLAGHDYNIDIIFTDLELEVLMDTFDNLDKQEKFPTDKRFMVLYKKIKQ